jgi:hypothetical protein
MYVLNPLKDVTVLTPRDENVYEVGSREAEAGENMGVPEGKRAGIEQSV